VEHPVTELITGIDLVEQMIRVAAGEKLKLTQGDIKLNGWAIEARVYAEDPFRNFLPSTGRLTAYRPPEEGTHSGLTIRNDTGVSEGGEISVYYDPMIAKLITHAGTRDAAIDHMIRALDAFFISGIQHNIPFLSAIMEHPRWRKGALSTGFIAEEYPDGFFHRLPDEQERVTLAIVAAAIDHLGNQRRREITHQMGGDGVRFAHQRVVRFGDDSQRVAVSGLFGKDIEVALIDDAGKEHDRTTVAFNWWFGDPIWIGKLNGVEVSVQVRPILNGFDLSYRGVHISAYVYTQREAELAALMPVKEPPDTSKQLLCPMPGLVVSIHVKKGQQVKAGDTLCVVEAMKMENILRAERDTTVADILAKPGDSLAVDATIMEFE
jgi:propionyl-CoA carboxylase alpha chain